MVTLRWTYDAFGERCDRWSSVLQALGVRQGDRVAYISPNTHALLTSFYAVPQLGAVLVPINYRLIPEEFCYLIEHSGASMVCADGDYLDAVDSIRARLPHVRHFVALDRAATAGSTTSRWSRRRRPCSRGRRSASAIC